jgi:hypothetical protein
VSAPGRPGSGLVDGRKAAAENGHGRGSSDVRAMPAIGAPDAANIP